MKEEVINIGVCKDYDNFFSKFMKEEEKGRLKEEYYGYHFTFHIMLDSGISETTNELLLFYFFLIANKLESVCSFEAVMHTDKTINEFLKSPNFFRLNTLISLQLQKRKSISARLCYTNPNSEVAIIKNFPTIPIKGIRNIIPLLPIDEEFLKTAQCPITHSLWKEIKTYKNDSEAKIDEGKNSSVNLIPNNSKEILVFLCHRLLFGKIENEAQLSKLRCAAFSLPDFFDAIIGLPLIALVIFALFDYNFRADLAAQYKSELRATLGNGKYELKPKDYFEEWQNEQSFGHFQVYSKLAGSGFDNKTLLNISNIKSNEFNKREFNNALERGALNDKVKLHPKLIGELYEAVTIAEGLLQLIENTVFHAGGYPSQDMGTGLMSMRVHRYTKSDDAEPTALDIRFPQYMSITRTKEKIRWQKVHITT